MRVALFVLALIWVAVPAFADDVDWTGRSISGDDLPEVRSDARNSDRPGSDFWLIQFPRRDGGDAGLGPCIRYCALSPRCAAYTYVKQTATEGGKCFLKSAAPARITNTCCESGVKADWGPPSAAVLARAPRNGNPPIGAPFPEPVFGRPLDAPGTVPPSTPPGVPPSPPLAPRDDFTIETGVDRPGSDYRGSIATNDPNDCLQYCGRYPDCRAFTWVRPGVQGLQGVCYLKNAVPAARADSCCSSGVKRAASRAAPARSYMASSPGLVASDTGASIIGRFVYGDPRWPPGRSFTQGECQRACDDPAGFFAGGVSGRCNAYTFVSSASELSCTLYERPGSGSLVLRDGGRSFFVR